MSPVQKDDFGKVSEQIISFLRNCATMIRKNDYIGFEELIAESITLMNQLTALKKGELKRIQGQSGSTKVSMVYLNMVQRGPERGLFYGEPFEGEQEVPEGIISLYYIGMMGDGACPVSTGL